MRNGSIEEEYRPLPRPSPPRSSLRSGRSPTRAGEKASVSFAQDYASTTFNMDSKEPERPVVQRPRTQPYTATLVNRQPTPDQDQDPVPKETVQASKAWDCEYSPARWSTTTPNLTPLRQPLFSEIQRDADLEARTSKLLELTSDLYVATHLPDHVTPLRSFSEVHRQSPVRRSVSADRVLDHLSPRLQRASSYKRAESPQRQRMGLVTLSPSSVLQDSLSSVLCSTLPGSDLKTSTRFQPINTTQSSRLGGNDCPAMSPSPQLGVSELSSALKGLLDLVDQHWSGTRSLHLNPSFLGRAYDILSALISPASPAASCLQDNEEWSDEKEGVGEESEDNENPTPHCSELAHLKRKLVQTQQQLESLKKRLVTALKENYNLRLTSLKQDSSIPANGDREWASCLQRQVKVLRKQETHLRQLEKTMELLQDNHRSLVSHNKSLLGQVNGSATEQLEESLSTQ